MTSVLLNGGPADPPSRAPTGAVALDDVSVTEWREPPWASNQLITSVALDDVSVTEWRPTFTQLFPSSLRVALDDVSVTEWRFLAASSVA